MPDLHGAGRFIGIAAALVVQILLVWRPEACRTRAEEEAAIAARSSSARAATAGSPTAQLAASAPAASFAVHPRLLYNGLCRPTTPGPAGSQPCLMAAAALAYLDQGLCSQANRRLVELDGWIEQQAAAPLGFYSLSEALHHALPACARTLPPPPFFRAACGGAKVPSNACLRGAALIQSARTGDCRGANAIWIELTGAAALENGGDPEDFQRLRQGLEDLVASCR